MTVMIPRRVREMTPDWLAQVLAEAGFPSTEVEALELEQINIGTGFAGRVLRLSPQYAEGADRGLPQTLIAKMPSPDPQIRGLIAEMRGYELEALFYHELADLTPTPIPFCYWNAGDVESGDFILLLEDLADYSIGGQTEVEVDPDLVGALVREAARLHAAWWNDSRLLAHSRLPDVDGAEFAAMQRNALAGLPVWESTVGSRYPREVVRGVGEGLKRLGELGRTAAAGSTTLVHGDYRLDNALYAAEKVERPLVVVDWQLIHRGSGAYDLAYLLGQSVPTEARRAHEDDWLRLYLTELGRSDYDEERLRYDYAIGLLRSMYIPVNGVGVNAAIRTQMTQMPPGPVLDGYEAALSAGEHLMATISDRCVTAILDHDALRVLV